MAHGSDNGSGGDALGPIGVMSWAFLVLSDVTTGASWICYYFASNRAS
ncbi:hypothetical protein [Olsenella uli]